MPESSPKRSTSTWRVLQFTFAYACLSATWSLTIHDSDAAQWALNVATLLEPHCRAESLR